MDISNISLIEIINMLFKKVLELLNITDITNINIAQITSNFISIMFISFIFIFLIWLIKAIGLYTMAKNNSDKYAFLAFIPYGCLYTKGAIIGKTKLYGIEINNPELLLPALVISMFLPFTKCITSIIFLFFYFGILYRLYQKQVPNLAVALLIFSIIIPILQPFFIFFIRNSNKSLNKQTKST